MISCIIHTKSLLFSSSISNSNVTCSVSGSGSVGPFGIKSTTSVELEMEEEKSNDFVWIMHEIIAYFFKKRYTRYNETTNWIKNTKKEPRPVKAWETLTASLNWLPPIN